RRAALATRVVVFATAQDAAAGRHHRGDSSGLNRSAPFWRTTISPSLDPWQMIEVLEVRVRRGEFVGRWRSVAWTCCEWLGHLLPPEASLWLEAAREFDAGRITKGLLDATRVIAWEFHDAHCDSWRPQQYAAFRAAMSLLGPGPDEDEWYDCAWFFLR